MKADFLCVPNQVKILAPVGSKTIHSSCAAQKSRTTTLVAIPASGEIIPPMHIFPGQQFAYDPLEGGVEGAFGIQAIGGSKQNCSMVGLKSIFLFVLDMSDQFC